MGTAVKNCSDGFLSGFLGIPAGGIWFVGSQLFGLGLLGWPMLVVGLFNSYQTPGLWDVVYSLVVGALPYGNFTFLWCWFKLSSLAHRWQARSVWLAGFFILGLFNGVAFISIGLSRSSADNFVFFNPIVCWLTAFALLLAASWIQVTELQKAVARPY